MRSVGGAALLEANGQLPVETRGQPDRRRSAAVWLRARPMTSGAALAVLALVLLLASRGDAQAAVNDARIEAPGQQGQTAEQTPPPQPARQSNTAGVVVLVVAVVGPAAGVTVSLVRARRRRAGGGSTEAGA